jgi:hypothetical protein
MEPEPKHKYRLETVDCFGLDTTEQYGYMTKAEHDSVRWDLRDGYLYSDIMWCDRYYPIDDAEWGKIQQWLKHRPM